MLGVFSLPLVILTCGQRSRRTTLLLLHQYNVLCTPFSQGISNCPEATELLSYLRYHTTTLGLMSTSNITSGSGLGNGEGRKKKGTGGTVNPENRKPQILIGEYFGLPSNRGRFRMGEHGYHKTRPSDILR